MENVVTDEKEKRKRATNVWTVNIEFIVPWRGNTHKVWTQSTEKRSWSLFFKNGSKTEAKDHQTLKTDLLNDL